jgi:hypothetical protein
VNVSSAALEPAGADRQTPRFDIRIAVRVCRSFRQGEAREETVLADNVGLGGARIDTTLPLTVGETVGLRDVGGPFRTAAKVRTINPEGQGFRAHLVFLASAATVRAWLVHAHVLPRPGRRLDIDLPLQGKRRAAFCAAIAHAFSGVPGDWRVLVKSVKGFSPPWWLVTVDGQYERFSLCLRTSEQSPAIVRQKLLEHLQRRHLAD